MSGLAHRWRAAPTNAISTVQARGSIALRSFGLNQGVLSLGGAAVLRQRNKEAGHDQSDGPINCPTDRSSRSLPALRTVNETSVSLNAPRDFLQLRQSMM